MTGIVSLSLESRDSVGKGESKKIRYAGYVPAVFYGQDYKESLKVKVKLSELAKYADSAHWETVRFEVSLPDGKKELCLLREIQRNLISDEILHADFIQLVKGHKVSVRIPLEPVNKEICKGVKAGGVFEQILHEINVDVLPKEIPDMISYDVKDLDVNESVHLSQITLPESAEVLDDHDAVVFSVTTSRSSMEIPEITEEMEEEVTEVEVIGKSKSGEEEEE